MDECMLRRVVKLSRPCCAVTLQHRPKRYNLWHTDAKERARTWKAKRMCDLQLWTTCPLLGCVQLMRACVPNYFCSALSSAPDKPPALVQQRTCQPQPDQQPTNCQP
jgi:hypothetical protein